MGFRSTLQLILIAAAVAIVFFVARPQYNEAVNLQNEIAKYGEAVDAVSRFNARLQQLLAQADQLTTNQRQQLETYLPEAIDELAVARDITFLAEENGGFVQSVSIGETVRSDVGNESEGQNTATSDPMLEGEGAAPPMEPGMEPGMGAGVAAAPGAQAPSLQNAELITQSFSLEMLGEYEDLKAVLRGFAKHTYPITVTKLEFSESPDSDLTSYTFELETYALEVVSE